MQVNRAARRARVRCSASPECHDPAVVRFEVSLGPRPSIVDREEHPTFAPNLPAAHATVGLAYQHAPMGDAVPFDPHLLTDKRPQVLRWRRHSAPPIRSRWRSVSITGAPHVCGSERLSHSTTKAVMNETHCIAPAYERGSGKEKFDLRRRADRGNTK